MRRRRRGAAFTMVEIIVVVIIIAALATLIVPTFFGRVGASKQSIAKQKIGEIGKAVEMFSYDYGRLPEDLDELVSRPSDVPESKWKPPTVKAKDLLDPWERKFLYKHPSEHGGAYDLLTYGADGKPGGEEEDSDIGNW